MIKGQDIVVLAKLMDKNAGELTYAELGEAARISASEAHSAIRRLQDASLVNGEKRLMKRNVRDFLMSSDFEDVICLFNGRASIVGEIASCELLKAPLSQKFAEYLKCPDLEDAVEGFVQTESNPERRRKNIMSAFAAVGSLL